MDFGPIGDLLIFAGFLAFALERLLEIFIAAWLPDVVAAIAARVIGALDEGQKQKARAWAMLAAGVAAGVVFAFGFGIDLFSPLAVARGLSANPVLGMSITGLIMGGGSNLVHIVFFGQRNLINAAGRWLVK